MTRQLAQPVAKATTMAVKKLFTHYNSKVVNEIKVELLQTALMTSFFFSASGSRFSPLQLCVRSERLTGA